MGDQPGDQGQQTYHARLESPVDYVPQRVVSLVPGMTESLFDLDLGHRLIAITDECVRPADKVKSLPRIGGTQTPDLHRIIDLQPDLVLINGDENRREDAESLRAAGIPLWITRPRSVFEVLNLLWNLMDLFDHAMMVPRVREIERAYDYNLGASRAMTPVRVFVPIWRDPWITFNAETYAHDVLRVCGGENVFAQRQRQSVPEPDLSQTALLSDNHPRIARHDPRYPHILLEEVIEAQPEIILLPDEPYPFSAADAEALRALDIPAAHNGKIHLIEGSLLTWHGTRVAYTLRDLPPLLMGSI